MLLAVDPWFDGVARTRSSDEPAGTLRVLELADHQREGTITAPIAGGRRERPTIP